MNELLSSATPTGEAGRAGARLLEGPPAFVDLLPVAIYACDAEGQVRWRNRRAAELVPDTAALPPGPAGAAVEAALRSGRAVRDAAAAGLQAHVEPLRDEDGRLAGAICCLHEAPPVGDVRASLEEAERRRIGLLEALPVALYTTDPAGRITFFNQAAVELWGGPPHPDENLWCGSRALLWPDGRPMAREECPMAVAIRENRAIRGAEAVLVRPDGSQVPFLPFPTPLHDGAGRLIGGVNMLVDIADRKATEDRYRLLLDEMNHRTKNMLVTVQSLAGQSFRGSEDLAAMREKFTGRLFALSKAHDMVARARWATVDLEDLVAGVLEPLPAFAEGRIGFGGEPVELVPRSALMLAMVLHELAANAVRHGALQQPTGRVDIAWHVERAEAGQDLHLEWQEAGGPPVAEPARRGFGLRLVERSLAGEPGGKAGVAFEPGGLRCRLRLALRHGG